MHKTCFKCLEVKPISEFYGHRSMKARVLGKCKPCTRADVKARTDRLNLDPAWREKELERQRKKAKRHRDEGRKPNKASSDAAKKRWQVKHAEKRAAHVAVNNAIKGGQISKMPCIVCGNLRAEAHHEDYSKPLDVIWYCSKHHAERHVEIRKIQRMMRNNPPTLTT